MMKKKRDPPQVFFSETHPEFFSQLLRQRSNNLLPVIRPFFPQDVFADALTHTPVQQNERRVYLPGYILSRLDDQES